MKSQNITSNYVVALGKLHYRAGKDLEPHATDVVFTESILCRSRLQGGDVRGVNGESLVGHVPMHDPVGITQHSKNSCLFVTRRRKTPPIWR